MLVGICTIDLCINEAFSLKDKRRVLKSIINRVHHRFNVSIAEVEYQEYWQKAVLGIAYLSNENAHIHRVLQQVVNFVGSFTEVEIITFSIEII